MSASQPVTDWRDLPQPNIDSTTMANWAKTWMNQLQHAVEYVDSGALPLYYGGDYGSYAADLTIGDVPWDEDGYAEFDALRQADPRWAKLEPVLLAWYATIFGKI